VSAEGHDDVGFQVTVAEVLRDALPTGTEVLVGGASLDRKVSWACVLKLRGGFAELEPGTVAIVNLETLRLMPSRPSLAQAIQALAPREVAAVAIRGQMEPYQTPMTRLMAERTGCALLQLPPGKESSVAAVEENVNNYLANRRTTVALAS
jgi:hypothetical protein